MDEKIVVDMASLSNVSRTLFCSSPQGNASKARGLAAFNDFRTSSVDVKKAPEPLSFIAPVTASPTDILVCQSEGMSKRVQCFENTIESDPNIGICIPSLVT